MTEIDRKVATWLAQVAEALEKVPACEADYGYFEVGKVEILFDEETTHYTVERDDHGGYAVFIGDASETADVEPS